MTSFSSCILCIRLVFGRSFFVLGIPVFSKAFCHWLSCLRFLSDRLKTFVPPASPFHPSLHSSALYLLFYLNISYIGRSEVSCKVSCRYSKCLIRIGGPSFNYVSDVADFRIYSVELAFSVSLFLCFFLLLFSIVCHITSFRFCYSSTRFFSVPPVVFLEKYTFAIDPV